MGDVQPSQRSSEPRYRYEAVIRIVIAANGLDEAHRVQQAAVANLKASATAVGAPIKAASCSIMDLHHRPDLDGSLKHG